MKVFLNIFYILKNIFILFILLISSTFVYFNPFFSPFLQLLLKFLLRSSSDFNKLIIYDFLEVFLSFIALGIFKFLSDSKILGSENEMKIE